MPARSTKSELTGNGVKDGLKHGKKYTHEQRLALQRAISFKRSKTFLQESLDSETGGCTSCAVTKGTRAGETSEGSYA